MCQKARLEGADTSNIEWIKKKRNYYLDTLPFLISEGLTSLLSNQEMI